MSLRLRLTLWYSFILTTVISFFGVAVWVILSISLIRQIDQRLQQTAAQVLNNSALVIQQGISFIEIPEPDTFRAAGLYVQVLNNKGILQGASRNLHGVDQPLDPLALTTEPGETTTHDVEAHGARLRVFTVPVAIQGQLIGYLQVGASLQQLDEARNLLLFVLIVGGAASVIVSFVIGSLTARRALRPLENVTQAALQITRADDLSRRIESKGLATDEVGRLIAAFNDTLERLERLFNTQRRLLQDISHELRTPLTVVRGNVDVLRRMGEADPVALDAMQTEAERMSRLVGDLMTLAQAESGTLPMVFEPVDLDTLLLEAYREAEVLAGNRVKVRLAEEDQATVSGDPDRLKQILLNLVGNALKYTPEGGTVQLGLRRGDGWAQLWVADSGPGIPEQDLPHIFDRFYRVEKSRKREDSNTVGAGLGLAIARWIVESHGGRIDVTSKRGEGSTFNVWLPLSEGEPMRDGHLPVARRPASINIAAATSLTADGDRR